MTLYFSSVWKNVLGILNFLIPPSYALELTFKCNKIISLYIKWAYRCMFICLLVCGGLMEIQTPATDLNEILQAHPHQSKENFGANLTPLPPPGSGEPESI